MAAPVLEWDVADRMRKALRVSKVGVQEMAEYLDVERGTVSTWINGRIGPKTQTLRLFALKTGVPFEWLRTGQVSGSNGPDDGGTASTRGYGIFPGQRVVGLRPSVFASAPNERALVA